MTEQPVTDVRILVVEDTPDHMKDVIFYLNDIHKRVRTNIGIGEITIVQAETVAEARKLLTAATSPYDLVVVDLRLPEEQVDDGSEAVANGLALIESIQATQTGKGMVAISAYDDYQNVRDAFKGGVLDFASKPLDQETFEPIVLNALQRLMTQDSDRLLNERVFKLVTQAQLGLAHGFRQVFFHLIKGVTETADKVEKYARERYGPDAAKDPGDPLTKALTSQRETIAKARQDWAEIQAELVPASSEFDSEDLSVMLSNLESKLKPALVVKRVVLKRPDSFTRPVHTFEKDVEVVLGEILAGAASELPNGGDVHKVKISFVTEETRVGVVLEDDLDPIPDKHAQAINAGLRIIADANFGRAWGLSVAQHVALRGGGEIKVEIKHGKNVVTYYVPLADHA